jgi:hypothetical protein
VIQQFNQTARHGTSGGSRSSAQRRAVTSWGPPHSQI